MKRIPRILLSLLLAPSVSFAFFCPSNFAQIQFGQTEAEVLEQCGKPDIQETKDVKKEGPQEWSYFVTQTVATSTNVPTTGTLKTQVVFDNTGKVINISVNGIGVGASNICGAKSIQLGDSRESIKSACGSPSFINSQQINDAGQALNEPDKMTTYIFNNTTPPTKLIFINGKLTKKE